MNFYLLVIILICIELVFTAFIAIKTISNSNSDKPLIFEPILLFLLSSATIYLIIPLLMMIFGWSWHDLPYSRSSYLQANLMAFGYIWAVYIIYYILFEYAYSPVINRLQSTSLRPDFQTLSRKQLYILIILFLVPIFLDTLYLIKYILSFTLSEYLKNRTILRKGMGGIVLISYMGTLLIPLLFGNFLLYIKEKNKTTKLFLSSIFFIFLVLPFLASYILMGNRLTAFVLLILLIFMYLVISNIKITSKLLLKFTLGILILFIFFTFLGYLRLMGVVNKDISNINLNLFFSLLGKEVEKAFVLNFGNFEHLVWLVEYKIKWYALQGETFIAGLLNIIPRSLIKDKLLGGGPHLKNFIHPGSYNLAKANISSYTTGIAIETYMNFKFFGLLIVPFFHAVLLLILKRTSELIKGNIILLSIYLYLLFSVSFLILFGEFLGIYTRSLVVSFPFIFFYLASKKQVYT